MQTFAGFFNSKYLFYSSRLIYLIVIVLKNLIAILIFGLNLIQIPLNS